MNINIDKKIENKSLKRTEVTFLVSYDSSTPKRQEVIEVLANLLKVKKELVILQSLNNKFGSKSADGKANIYTDEEALKRIEREYLSKRLEKKEKK